MGEAVEGALKQMQYRSDIILLQLADLHDKQVRNLSTESLHGLKLYLDNEVK